MAKLIAIYLPDDRIIRMDHLPPGSRTARIDLPDHLPITKIYGFAYKLADLLLRSLTTVPAPPPPRETADPAPALPPEDPPTA